MTKSQKFLLILGTVGLLIGGFAIAKFLTRNVRNIRGGTVKLQTYDVPPIEEPLTE